MSYICLIETESSSVPHMEPLMADDLPEARNHAVRLLRQHGKPVAAHIFLGDKRLETVTVDTLGAR